MRRLETSPGQPNRTPREAAETPTGGRPPEMDDWLNARIFHPLAHKLAVALVPTPVSPNAVSIGGGLLIVAAAFLYTGLSWPVSVVLGFTSHALWHVLDGADGELARRTGKASPIGELVDGVCDYAGHIVLYVVLAAYLDNWIGGWGWFMAVAAGASRILQSNHAESQRRTYLWRVYGIPWLKHAYAERDEALKRAGLFTRMFEPFARGYVALASASNPLSAKVEAIIARARGAPQERERVSRVCRDASAASLRAQTLLGPNLRTVALGLSMLAGSPLWFFLFECVPLNLLLVWSSRLQKRCDESIVGTFDG